MEKMKYLKKNSDWEASKLDERHQSVYQKAQETPKGINAEKNIPRYFTVKTAEN